MSRNTKLKVHTVGLGEFYGITPEHRDLREREPMEIEQLMEILLRILDETEPGEAEGQFILEHGGNRIYLQLNGGQFQISDPKDANMQNIPVETGDLPNALKDYFNLHAEPAYEPVQNSHLILLEWIIAVVVGAGMVAAFVMVADFLEHQDTFMPEPHYTPINSEAQNRATMERLKGIYLTDLRTDETVLEIHPDGSWTFFDIEKGKGSMYKAQPVLSGVCRPVEIEDRVALLDEDNYLFDIGTSDQLVFQDRVYTRSGRSWEDLAFLQY